MILPQISLGKRNSNPPTTLQGLIDYLERVIKERAARYQKSLLAKKKKTKHMKQQSDSGERSGRPSITSDAKLLEMELDASDEPRYIRITFRGESGSFCGISGTSLPSVKGVMTISMQPPSGLEIKDTSSRPTRPHPDTATERWNWGED